jgi:polar amino acid transport system substrate-binding protein
LFVLASSPAQAAVDLCGEKVGSMRSTIYPLEIEKWSKANCETAGKPAVQFSPGNAVDVRNQLKQGRIDAVVQGNETLPYALKQEPGKYRIVGEPFSTGHQGIMFRKDDTVLRQAVMDALAAMIADGAYQSILAKWA